MCCFIAQRLHHISRYLQADYKSKIINGAEIDKCLDRDFSMWFKLYAQNASLVPNEIVRDLGSGLLRSVRSVPIYYVNGGDFDYRVSPTSDKKTALFKCEWFDPTLKVGTRIHQCYNIVEGNCRKKLNVYDPFILAMQAMQVYFSNYPRLKWDKIDWLVACKVKARPLVEMPQITESRDCDAFQDDAPDHLNMIDTNDIHTRLNDFEGTSIDLDDDEECSEEETPIDSDEEESSKTDDSDEHDYESDQ
ncbi:hypothetical protein POM88_000650 [Heracleum sosnowskyi]|uniref:DUF4216 domain-containing protein n=1 Tax=Heracleum sosnowskyi TaxID=360622 RepID=A0AAD8JAR1_9APIA|nr:hypothetical protein POM88_000650 [Heracleum sosnowskyi]